MLSSLAEKHHACSGKANYNPCKNSKLYNITLPSYITRSLISTDTCFSRNEASLPFVAAMSPLVSKS